MSESRATALYRTIVEALLQADIIAHVYTSTGVAVKFGAPAQPVLVVVCLTKADALRAQEVLAVAGIVYYSRLYMNSYDTHAVAFRVPNGLS